MPGIKLRLNLSNFFKLSTETFIELNSVAYIFLNYHCEKVLSCLCKPKPRVK